MWDPMQYVRFGDERSRPFHELVARVGADPDDVKTVVDLGCGPGALTATLADRFVRAHIIGVDNDEAMLHAAAEHTTQHVSFEHGDISTWKVDNAVDVLISNAAFQWDLGHLERLPTLISNVRPGGWFAFQVPGNLDDPHHQAIREVRRRPRWATIPALAALADRTHVSKPATVYADALAQHASHLDAWETTYVHILQGDEPVLEWLKGTALRPVLTALESDAMRAEFCDELAALLRTAYPAKPYGTPFPFRRVFVVAQR